MSPWFSASSRVTVLTMSKGAPARTISSSRILRNLRAPGSFELPIIAQACATSGYDAVIALGVIIRGGTPHFEYVSAAATDRLARVALDTGVPVGFGLLTCDDEQQALDRAGLPGSKEDKGAEAAQAAVATVLALRSLDGSRDSAW